MTAPIVKIVFTIAAALIAVGLNIKEVSDAKSDVTTEFNHNGKTYSLFLSSPDTVVVTGLDEGLSIKYEFLGPPSYAIKPTMASYNPGIDHGLANALHESFRTPGIKEKIKQATCGMTREAKGKISVSPWALNLYGRAFQFYGMHC